MKFTRASVCGFARHLIWIFASISSLADICHVSVLLLHQLVELGALTAIDEETFDSVAGAIFSILVCSRIRRELAKGFGKVLLTFFDAPLAREHFA